MVQLVRRRLKQIIDDNQQQLLLEIRKHNKNDNQLMAIEEQPPPGTVVFNEIVDDENGVGRPEQVYLWNHKDGKLTAGTTGVDIP